MSDLVHTFLNLDSLLAMCSDIGDVPKVYCSYSCAFVYVASCLKYPYLIVNILPKMYYIEAVCRI